MKNGHKAPAATMNVDFGIVLLTIRGKPLQIEEKPALKDAQGNELEPAETRDMTLGDAAVNALDAPDPDDKPGQQQGQNKLTKYRLMQKVIAGTGSIDATEASMITTQVAKFYPPSIYGQVNDLLAPKTPVAADK